MSVTGPALNDEFNAALQSYVCSFPSDERLEKHVAKHTPEKALRITNELRSVVNAATDYLWAQKQGVRLVPEEQKRYFAFLQGLHPWLTNESLNCMWGYAGWLCWHEGLGSSEQS